MSDKIYCGNGKTRDTKFGQRLRLSFSADDLVKLQDNLSNGWVSVDVNKRKEVSDKGITHYLTIDTWKPSPSDTKDEPEDNLPF